MGVLKNEYVPEWSKGSDCNSDNKTRQFEPDRALNKLTW